MSDRFESITSRAATTEDCEDCNDDGLCDRHWLVHEVHRLRGAIHTHREHLEAHREAARERHADLPGEDDLHGIHQDLWAAVEGRDTPV